MWTAKLLLQLLVVVGVLKTGPVAPKGRAAVGQIHEKELGILAPHPRNLKELVSQFPVFGQGTVQTFVFDILRPQRGLRQVLSDFDLSIDGRRRDQEQEFGACC